MRHFVLLISALIIFGSGCASTIEECRVLKVAGNTVQTEGCSEWQPLQFGEDRVCMEAIGLKMEGDMFTLKQSSACRYFTLKHPNGKWLMIDSESSSHRSNLCVSEPTKGKGYAYHACR
jgi:hypothetical protein